MPKYRYRITLVATEATTGKSRTKNLGELTCMETDNRRDAMHETRRLREMIECESWKVPAQIVAERSEITDFSPVDIDTLEPARQDDDTPQPFPDLAAKSMESWE